MSSSSWGDCPIAISLISDEIEKYCIDSPPTIRDNLEAEFQYEGMNLSNGGWIQLMIRASPKGGKMYRHRRNQHNDKSKTAFQFTLLAGISCLLLAAAGVSLAGPQRALSETKQEIFESEEFVPGGWLEATKMF